MDWNVPINLTNEVSLMAKLKDNLSITANNLLDVVPLATATISTALVATNSWLTELINEDADFDKVNELKAKMMNQPTSAKA